MRILLLSFHTPSEATYAASRARKLGCFLLDRGHDVRVLSSAETGAAAGFDPDHVVMSPTRDAFLAGATQTLRSKIVGMCGGGRRKTDKELFWQKTAFETATKLFETWKPDIIYAICPPISSALIADRLSRDNDIPFVIEQCNRPQSEEKRKRSDRRRQHETLRERDSFRRAAAIVTPSPVWTQTLANLFGSGKVNIAMDGFDPAHYPLTAPFSPDPDRKTLRLYYSIPPEGALSDLATLFDGMAALGEGAKDVRLTLAGNNVDAVLDMARLAGVQRQVDPVALGSNDDAIQLQYCADALVLATRNDPEEAGTVPAELFNYIGTRRPLIVMGYSKGVAAQIIRKRDLGLLSNEPKVIANRLAKLLATKRAVGVVPPLPEKVRENATIAAQFAGLEPMLYGVVGSVPLSVAAE